MKRLMKRASKASIPMLFAASAVLAQDEAAQVVGAVLGGVIGLILVIIIGAVVGWLASLIVKGRGSGFWGDVLLGIGGSLLAGYLLPLFGVYSGGTVGSLIAAVIGAIVLILIVQAVRKST